MLRHPLAIIALTITLTHFSYRDADGAQPDARVAAADPSRSRRAYGEWRIQIRPDQLAAYARLIESKGLPLFREAGGRMVGWWTTLIGDLYEHVTLWEYDNMAAFEKAVAMLGSDPRFAEFVAQRDPLLTGEQNRFLHLADFAVDPELPMQAKIVVHETLRIPLEHRDAYLKFMQSQGLSLLRSQGLRPIGPWVVGVGRWSEISYLFGYESLAERDKLLAAFAVQPEGVAYSAKIDSLADDVTTRVLLPAPFAHGEE